MSFAAERCSALFGLLNFDALAEQKFLLNDKNELFDFSSTNASGDPIKSRGLDFFILDEKFRDPVLWKNIPPNHYVKKLVALDELRPDELRSLFAELMLKDEKIYNFFDIFVRDPVTKKYLVENLVAPFLKLSDPESKPTRGFLIQLLKHYKIKPVRS